MNDIWQWLDGPVAHWELIAVFLFLVGYIAKTQVANEALHKQIAELRYDLNASSPRTDS